MRLSDLTQKLNNYLSTEAIGDYAPNGLQVACSDKKIGKIALAVTASEEAIIEAAKIRADVLIVHHGYFWKGEDPVITGIKYQRIRTLITNDIGLLAYHLPLDVHPTLGNNIQLARVLGLELQDTFKPDGKLPLLAIGKYNKAISLQDFADHCAKVLQREPLIIAGGEHLIHTVAWCTGAAQDFITDAKLCGADVYLSGEVAERTYYQARELGIHYLACGHHATERYGIQALGQWIQSEFGIITTFIDSKNPI